MEPEFSFDQNEERVLYCALSPSGEDLVTGSNSMLKFWKVFESINQQTIEEFNDFEVFLR